MPDRLPGAVLFACNYNRVRSPMAEALMRRQFGARVYVASCGVLRDPDDTPDPFAAAVMAETGLDLAAHQPQTFDELDDDAFDLVVSLTPEAQHRAVELARRRAIDLEYWPTSDPTLAAGSREAVLDAYRALRDALKARIRERFGGALNPGG